jgi:FAD/FMN-containing dehydrogenase
MPNTENVSSWGSVCAAEHVVLSLAERQAGFPSLDPTASLLARGNGRSYGDICLNSGQTLVRMRNLDRFIRFDKHTGLLACESGVLLADILKLTLPLGWTLPVAPGTLLVTVGGAIANDVHGKNHHQYGTFATSLVRFELLRSDGQRLLCSRAQSADMFAATLGGLGLTGIITWAEIQLRRVPGPWVDVETIRFGNLDEFIGLCAQSDSGYEYTVAWVDCRASGRRLGRGLLQRANHSSRTNPVPPRSGLSVPITPPFSVINRLTLRAFNSLYYHRQLASLRRSEQPLISFLCPLDRVGHWNRVYGPKGFYQYQSVIPGSAGRDATAAMLETIARSGQGSFLAVLKLFGNKPSPGLMSFPQEGITLAVDFPNRGAVSETLFRSLDAIVQQAGGRLYPAKDGRMPGALFRSGYPRWQEFASFIDPRCSSNFWRRVMENV